jgi:hypothetical protein
MKTLIVTLALLVPLVAPIKIEKDRVYQTDRVGRVLTEKGYYNLKDKSFTDGKGRKSYIQPFPVVRERDVR